MAMPLARSYAIRNRSPEVQGWWSQLHARKCREMYEAARRASTAGDAAGVKIDPTKQETPGLAGPEVSTDSNPVWTDRNGCKSDGA